MASRRAAEDLIREGRVRVNGRVVQELGAKADPSRDRITVDGRAAVPRRLQYFAYHKPVGVVSTMSDPEGRPAIGDVVRGLREHVFPVGRLDYESSGLVLLTNDGELAQRLTHPRYQVPKVYRVKVRGRPDEAALERLRRGVRLADGMTAPAEVTVESLLPNKTRLRIAIREGRQRQVRRMCEAIGHPVDKLSRIAIGPLRLGSLRVGEIRELTPREVLALRHAVAGRRPLGERPAPPRPEAGTRRAAPAPRRTTRASERSTPRSPR
ncbi:MAG TPA: pseudouridine synthase [Candidatus Binatia bacterium]